MLGDFDFFDSGRVQGVGKNAVNRVGWRDDEVALAELVGDAGKIEGA